MSWEYRLLCRRLRVRRNRLLECFERFGEEAATDITRMEWSVSIRSGEIDPHRFVIVANGVEDGRGATPAFARLLRSAGLGEPPKDAFATALATCAPVVSVAYASGGANGVPTLKAYLGWHGPSHDLDAAIVGKRGKPLPGAPIRALGRSVDTNGHMAARAYLFYGEAAARDEAVISWLAHRVGRTAAGLLAIHPRFGLANKPGRRNTLLVGLRPSGHVGPHPSHTHSPLLLPVHALAGRVPELRERLDRVTWIAASTDVLRCRAGDLPRDLGVYTALVS